MKGSGIGGQAVMEGVMMKNGDQYAVAVRKEDGEIVVQTKTFRKTGGGLKVFDLPIIRGAVAFIDSLRLGIGTLMYSASFFEDEDDGKKKKTAEQKKKEDNAMMVITVIVSILLAVGIFMILPYYLSLLLKELIKSTALLTLCEGLIRIILFITYIVAISCMKDIKRVFMYHGAEHKSINCIENGLELNVENVRKSSRRHKRCGTSFLLIVMLISVFFFMFIRVESAWLRVGLRLLLIPVIAGVSYEFIKLAGRSNSKFVDILSRPGLALQGLTTSEPDDSMIEVAIRSVEAVFDWQKFLEDYDKKVDAGKNDNPQKKGNNAGNKGGVNPQKTDSKNRKQNNDNSRKQKTENANLTEKDKQKKDQQKNDQQKNDQKKNDQKKNDQLKNNNDTKNKESDLTKETGKPAEEKINKPVEDKTNKPAEEKTGKPAEDKPGKPAEKGNEDAPGLKKKADGADTRFNHRETIPVDDDEDDEILNALDQFLFTVKKDEKNE